MARPRHDWGGASTHPTYRRWIQMLRRCSAAAGPRDRANYFDRGITVCPEWADDYLVFREWALSHGWAPSLHLDRVDNDGPYSPSNCRWVTVSQNLRNRRGNQLVSAWGETKPLVEWIEDPRCLVGYHVAWNRLVRSPRAWSAEQALTTPTRGWARGGPHAR